MIPSLHGAPGAGAGVVPHHQPAFGQVRLLDEKGHAPYTRSCVGEGEVLSNNPSPARPSRT